MKTKNYRIEITGRQPVVTECKLRASAYNAAEKGLSLRAEPGATATVTSLKLGKVIKAYGTNERGDVYCDS